MTDNEILFDYNKIDTQGVQGISDAALLERVKRVPVIDTMGWAIIAELAKRFEDIKGEP